LESDRLRRHAYLAKNALLNGELKVDTDRLLFDFVYGGSIGHTQGHILREAYRSSTITSMLAAGRIPRVTMIMTTLNLALLSANTPLRNTLLEHYKNGTLIKPTEIKDRLLEATGVMLDDFKDDEIEEAVQMLYRDPEFLKVAGTTNVPSTLPE
jgi:hypothetical protein